MAKARLNLAQEEERGIMRTTLGAFSPNFPLGRATAVESFQAKLEIRELSLKWAGPHRRTVSHIADVLLTEKYPG